MADMPQPTAEHHRLAAFAGTWEGDETLHPAAPYRPDAVRARGRFESRMALDGFYLIVDYVEHQGTRRSYAGHGVYGWDAKAGTYTMWWFDVMGGGYDQVVRGTWEGHVLTFVAKAPFGHARYVYEVHSETEFGFAIDTSPDGVAWTQFMEGRYHRV